MGNDTIEGGEGNDYIKDYYGSNSILAGDGADEIHIAGSSSFIDAGSDTSNDRIYYSDLTGDNIIIAGLGDDHVERRHISEVTNRVHENLIVYLDQQSGESNDDGNDTFSSDDDPHLSLQVYGQGGNDNLSGSAVNSLLDGGSGDDTITGSYLTNNDRLTTFGDLSSFEWRASVKGGEGEDTLYFSYYSNIDYTWDTDFVLDGGPGNDTLESQGGWDPWNGWTRNPGIRGLGGDGNDTFKINGFIKDIALSGGSGSDLYVLHENHYLNKLEWPSRVGVESTFTISDFEAGEGGDTLDINAYIDTNFLTGYNSGNPFSPDLGFLRFEQHTNGLDIEFQIDKDGAAGTSYNFESILLLKDVDLSRLTAWNTSLGRRITGNVADFSKPEIYLANDNGLSRSDLITNDSTLNIYNANSGGVLEISLDNGGTWIVWESANQPTFAEGTHTIQVRENIGGQISLPEILTFTLDTTSPASASQPQIDPADRYGAADSGLITGDLTTEASPHLIGTADPDSYVFIIKDDDIMSIKDDALGFGISDTNGDYSVQLNNLGDGSYNLIAVAMDLAGNTATHSNSRGLQIETISPTLISAETTTDGGTIRILFSKLLNPNTLNPSDFAVTINSSQIEISNIIVEDAAIMLVVDETVDPYDDVSIAYTRQNGSTNAIQDKYKNQTASFAANVANKVPDIDSPSFIGATMNQDGTFITLSFSEELSDNLPSIDSLELQVNQEQITISSVKKNGSALIITPDAPFSDGQLVTLTYKDPNSDDDQQAIQDRSGNDLQSIAKTVINNVLLDNNAPINKSAYSDPKGEKVILKYNEPINPELTEVSLFTVTVDGRPVTINDLTVSLFEVHLNLDQPISNTAGIQTTYSTPQATGAWAIEGPGSSWKSDFGHAAATFTDGSSIITGAVGGHEGDGQGTTYIRRFMADGSDDWTTTIDAIGANQGNGVAAFNDGSSIIAGTFRNDITLGSTTLTGSNSNDIFITKLDADGDFQWATALTNNGNANITQIDGYTDSEGSFVYVAGTFYSDNITFNSTSAASQTGSGSGASSGFLAKYSFDGDLIWHKIITVGSNDSVIDLDANQQGSVAITGLINGLTYINSYSADGSLNWISSAEGEAKAVSLFGDGSVALAGDQYGDISLTDAKGDNITIAGNKTNGKSGYLARTNAEGSFVWGYPIHGDQNAAAIGDQDVRDLAAVNDGSTIVVGRYFETLRFEDLSTTFNKTGETDGYITKIDSDGHGVWATKFGGTWYDSIRSVSTFQDNSAIIAGQFGNPISLGDITIQGQSGGGDLFAAKIYSNGLWTPETAPSGITDLAGNKASAHSMPVENRRAPIFTQAVTSVNGDQIVLTFDEPLNYTTTVPSAFSVTTDDITNPVTAVAISDNTVELTLSNTVNNEGRVTFAYTDPTSDNDANAIQDLAGNDTASIPSSSVTNISTIAGSSPIFTSSIIAPSILENSGSNQVVYTAQAIDKTSVVYKLDPSADDFSDFTINILSGEVTLTRDPDYEFRNSYAFRVLATDQAGNSSAQAVSLAILDLDDHLPVFTSGGVASAIEENTGSGQIIYTAEATDSSTLSYSLRSTAADASSFSIDGQTGVVTLLDNPDYEQKSNYEFIVAATDSAGNVAEQSVSLQIHDDLNDNPFYQISAHSNLIEYQARRSLALPLLFSSSDGLASAGLTFQLHYNSSLFTFVSIDNPLQELNDYSTSADVTDADNDSSTDTVLNVSIDSSAASLASGSQLGTVHFEVADLSPANPDPITGLRSSVMNLTATAVAEGYGFSADPITLEPVLFSLDVDGDGDVTALGDGLMVIRKLFGNAFAGDALTNKAISPNAIRSTQEIHDYIESGIIGGFLDVDLDNETTALGDGLMVIRHLFGAAFAGDALTSKAISPDSPYFSEGNGWENVAANIDRLIPQL